METHTITGTVSPDLVITLFLAAMSRPQADRAEFLRESCRGNDDLAAEVERRVNWEERLGGFLLNPVLPREHADNSFAPGDILLSRFRILRVAGQGGMGVVYEAHDEKLGRRIALKCPRLEFRKRISPEVLKSLAITHANVCRVFELHTAKTDTGEIDFLTMEFLEGETLAARLVHAPPHWLETAEGKDIAHQICAGLGAVHAAGVVHRDLKPGNVMLSTGPLGLIRVVIMDFGIAQGADMFSSQLRGTPAYLAPELWRGEPATIQSDIYALGVLLYEMACGRKPFPEGTPWKQRLNDLPAPAEAREPLRSALAGCLHPDPKRRLQSTAEFERANRAVSRRAILGGAIGLGATGLTAELLRERFWPSPVRLAILPPSIINADTDSQALINSFLSDLAYSLKTLRGVQRPWGVLSASQTAPEGVTTSAAAKKIMGATHALLSSFRLNFSGWSIGMEILPTSGGEALQRWDQVAAVTGLAGELFTLHTSVVELILRKLLPRVEHKPQTLTQQVYGDYLLGQYYARNDYENAGKAMPFFERVIASAPESALRHAGMAEAWWNRRYETGHESYKGRALAELGKAALLDPEMAQVYLMRGRLEADSGQHEDALADCKRASELAPHDAEAFLELAVLYWEIHRPQETEAALQSAISAEPGYYKPYLDTGVLYYMRRDLPAAERYWLQAVHLGPSQTQSRLNLAEMYIGMGRMADAEKQIRDSLKLGRNQNTLAVLGLLQDRQGHYNDAVASYEEAIHVGPPSYMIWAGVGIAYRHAGRHAEALRAFSEGLQNALRGVRHYAREAGPLAWCAYYHAQLGHAAETRSFARQALAMESPPELDVIKNLVLSYDAIGDIEPALRLLIGAPRVLVKEIVRGNELSPVLRRDPRLERLLH